MRLRPLLASLVFLGSFLLGCGDDPVTFATYNGGLAQGFVPYTPERAPQIVRDFPAGDLDVICVQEFWDQMYWDQLTSSVSASHPHTFRRPPEADTGGASCMEGDLDALEVCVMDNCPGATPETLATCALDMCETEIDGLPDDCLNCLVANVSLGDIDMIRTACEVEGASYAYEGSFGTGILSRYPLADTDSLLMDSTATRRAVLYARIPDTPQGEVHFFCTHLTANLESVPYTGDFGGWPEEQAMQIQALLAWAETKAGGSDNWIVAGDLNNGPALPDIDAELPDNYAMWAAGGLRDPYVSQADAVCTYCNENPLNLGTMAGGGGLIDHVLLADGIADGTGFRFLDQRITIDVMGMSQESAYSDHYGFALTVGQ
jgi:hypothetical protein